MNKILKIAFLLVFSISVLWAQEKTKTTDNETVTTETITETDGIRRVIIKKSGMVSTVTKPETTVTTIIPKRVIVRELLDTFLDVGIRSSLDYHLTPGRTTVSCLWFWAEIRRTAWGIEMGLGKAELPMDSYTDVYGTTNNTGVGLSTYWQVDLIAKYNFWFYRPLWVGAGFNYYIFQSGSFIDTTTNGTQSSLDVTNYANSYLYAQIAVGVRVALDAERLYFAPDVRYMYPLNGDNFNKNGILRLNLGLAYTFNL